MVKKMFLKNRLSLPTIKILIILLFVFLYYIIYLITTTYKDDYIKNIYTEQVNYLDNNYKVTTSHFKNISQNFYETTLSNPSFLKLFAEAKHADSDEKRAIIREKMYELLRPHYERMMQYGVNIMLL